MNSQISQSFQQILESIQSAKRELPPPWVAAFDADGTLWNVDLGENFFDYQIRNSNLKLPFDPWGHYRQSKINDTARAYLWLAQINTGQKFTQVQKWAEAAFCEIKPAPFFEFQRRLIKALQDEDFEIFIVTASVKWAVEPGAARLGVPAANVLGVHTKIRNGVVTDDPDGEITWREGKANELLRATNGVRPILAIGNTLSDLAMISSATHVHIAVRSHKSHEHLFDIESELQVEAEKRNWLQLDLSHNPTGDGFESPRLLRIKS